MCVAPLPPPRPCHHLPALGCTLTASFSHETSFYIHLRVDLHNVIIFKSKDSPFDVEAAMP
jgi:hypothetical protein